MRMRSGRWLMVLAVLMLTPIAGARQSSLRSYNIEYAQDDPFVGFFAGGASIPKIGKHGFATVEITRDTKQRLDLVLTLAQFGIYNYRCQNVRIEKDVLRFAVPPPPGADSAVGELRVSPDGQRIEGFVTYFPESLERPQSRIVAVRRPDLLSMDTIYSWEGVIEQVNSPLALTLRVGTRADGLAVGQFDIPEHQYYGATLANLQYEPEIDLFIASIPEKVNGMLELHIRDNARVLEGRYVREHAVSPAEFHATDTLSIPRAFLNEGNGRTVGELTLPSGKGPFPCVVILGTFGPNDRNGVNVNTGTHEPYRRLAEFLTNNGYAVYRFDDRSTGMSRDAQPASNLGSLAADAANALAMLANTQRLDPEKLILLGHGEGGAIAPMLLSRSPAPAGLILLNAPVGSGVDFLVEQAAATMTARGMHPSRVDARARHNAAFLNAVVRGASDAELLEIVRAYIRFMRENVGEQAAASLPTVERAFEQDKAAMANPMTRSVASWDNATALAAAKVPVLALFGAKDVSVPSATAALRAQQAFSAGNADAAVKVLDGLNHYFQPAETGLDAEYADPARTPFDAAALNEILQWLKRNFPVG